MEGNTVYIDVSMLDQGVTSSIVDMMHVSFWNLYSKDVPSRDEMKSAMMSGLGDDCRSIIKNYFEFLSDDLSIDVEDVELINKYLFVYE